MPYVAAIGHRISLHCLLDKFGFEDIEEAKISLEEAGLTIFSNSSQDIFIVVNDKYIIIKGDQYIDLDLALALMDDEYNLLKIYTNQTDKRIKLFWTDPEDDNEEEDDILNDKSLLLAILERMNEEKNNTNPDIST
jgi:hypothetical protein